MEVLRCGLTHVSGMAAASWGAAETKAGVQARNATPENSAPLCNQACGYALPFKPSIVA